MFFRRPEGLWSESFHQKRKKTLKLEVQLDFEDVENSEFDYFFGENFRFKAPQLSEKSSESMLYIFKTLSELSAIRQ